MELQQAMRTRGNEVWKVRIWLGDLGQKPITPCVHSFDGHGCSNYIEKYILVFLAFIGRLHVFFSHILSFPKSVEPTCTCQVFDDQFVSPIALCCIWGHCLGSPIHIQIFLSKQPLRRRGNEECGKLGIKLGTYMLGQVCTLWRISTIESAWKDVVINSCASLILFFGAISLLFSFLCFFFGTCNPNPKTHYNPLEQIVYKRRENTKE